MIIMHPSLKQVDNSSERIIKIGVAVFAKVVTQTKRIIQQIAPFLYVG